MFPLKNLARKGLKKTGLRYVPRYLELNVDSIAVRILLGRTAERDRSDFL